MTTTRKTYRQSEINDFMKCGKMWDFRYLQKIPTRPNGNLSLGSSVDRAVTAALSSKAMLGEAIPLNEVLQIGSDDLDSRMGETDWKEEDPGKAKDVAVKLITLYVNQVLPLMDPETVQEQFHLELEGVDYDMIGTIDLIEKSGVVRDTKTAKNAYAEDHVSKNIQAAMYDFAYESLRGKKSPAFMFDVLKKPTTKNPAVYQAVGGPVTTADREFLFDTIANMDKAIKAGVAMPASDQAWWCSPDFCPYWLHCKGKK